MAFVLHVKVKPNARRTKLTILPDGTWVADVKSPPVDGRANAELIALVAERFQCHKSDVSIRAGASGRLKIVRVEVG